MEWENVRRSGVGVGQGWGGGSARWVDRVWVRLPLGTAQALGGGPVVWKQESVVLVRPKEFMI